MTHVHRFIASVLVFGLASTLGSAQGAPSCAAALDSLDGRVRQNYAGFLLEVRGQRREDFDRMARAAHARADTTVFAGCFPVLDGYVRWYGDPHLFVFQAGSDDSVSMRARRESLQVVSLSEDSARVLISHGSHPDPIEGIWFDGPTRYAVLRDPGDSAHFRAIQLASDTVGWPAGAIRARFWKLRDGTYHTELLNRRFGLTIHRAHLHKRTVLRLDPGMWGKAFPVAAADTGLIAPDDVHAAVASPRQRSLVISIPSHDPRFRVRLERALLQNADAIRRTGLLILDLRGNEGGSATTTRVLDPWLASLPARSTPFDSGEAVILSSPAQIAYARRFTGTDTSSFVRSLVRRMEATPGALVPLFEQPQPAPADSVLPGAWRIVVLIDRGTVSAAEVLVLKGLRSTRTVVVGEPTAGALDYQSTQIVGLGLPDRRWALGYPTITAHANLPRRGMRATGIQPDVRVDWSKVADPIAFVERRYAPSSSR